MEARDILRIVLFFIIAVYAFHPSVLLKIKNLSKQNIQEENEEKEKQLLQKRHNVKNRLIQEPKEYENEMSEKTNISV